MKKYIIYILLLLVGCTKQDETPPQILLTSPFDNQEFSPGQTVVIKGSIQGANEIHAAHLVVTTAAGVHIIHTEEHVDAKTYAIDNSFIMQAATTYLVHVDASDHSGNVATKEITVLAK